MAVSTNSTQEFQRDEIIDMAYGLCGLPAPSTDEAQQTAASKRTKAARYLNLELQALQAEGVILRTIERTTLTLVAGTATYSLPTDTVGVKRGPNDNAGTIVNTSSTETVVTVMSRAEYLDITNKSTSVTAIPTRVLIEDSLSPLQVTFHPAPDSTAVTWRYARVRLFKALDAGNFTVDLPQRWTKWLTLQLATHVARLESLVPETIADLRSEAADAKDIVLGQDVEPQRVRYRVSHSGRHW